MDRAIRGEGSASPAWQAWLSQWPPAPLARPTPGSRLVVVAPHPDDELLTCAGLIRQHISHGGACTVVAVTDGEASHSDVPDITPAQLRSTRQAESAAGLNELGLGRDDVLRLGLPDGDVSRHRGQLTRQLSECLLTTDCVVTTWRLDGHPDHEATGASVADACRATGCRLLEAPVWMWHWATPAQAGIPWARLRALALGADELRRKRDALARHVSQLTPRGPTQGPVIEPTLRQRAAWPHEYFFVDEAEP